MNSAIIYTPYSSHLWEVESDSSRADETRYRAVRLLRRKLLNHPSIRAFFEKDQRLLHLAVKMVEYLLKELPEAEIDLLPPEGEEPPYLYLIVRLPDYPDDFLNKLVIIRQKFYDDMRLTHGWIVLTTDFA